MDDTQQQIEEVFVSSTLSGKQTTLCRELFAFMTNCLSSVEAGSNRSTAGKTGLPRQAKNLSDFLLPMQDSSCVHNTKESLLVEKYKNHMCS